MEFRSPVDAVNGLMDFIIDRTAPLPNRLRDRLRETLKERSPVKGMIRAIELVYSRDQRREDVPDEMLEWAAAAAVLAEEQGFHSMAEETRGSLIAMTLRRQAIADEEKPAVDEIIAEAAAPVPPAPLVEPAVELVEPPVAVDVELPVVEAPAPNA